MNKNSLSISLVMFVMSILLFSVATFAWFTLSDAARLGSFEVGVSKYEADIDFQIRKNSTDEQDFVTLESKEAVQAFLRFALPSDQFDFRITITNLSTNDVTARISFNDVISYNTSSNLDMRNVFYINSGVISIDGNPGTADINSTTPVTVEGQTLNQYRLSNIIDQNDDFLIMDNLSLGINDTVLIEFSLTFDASTEHEGYQGGFLEIDHVYVEFDT